MRSGTGSPNRNILCPGAGFVVRGIGADPCVKGAGRLLQQMLSPRIDLIRVHLVTLRKVRHRDLLPQSRRPDLAGGWSILAFRARARSCKCHRPAAILAQKASHPVDVGFKSIAFQEADQSQRR
jgi:hypothetical protein